LVYLVRFIYLSIYLSHKLTIHLCRSSPLLVATDPIDLTEVKKSILMNPEVIAINQDPLFISGERIRNDNTTTGGQVWTRPLQNGDLCVILYNSGNMNEVNVSVTWNEIGWAESKVFIRDLWNQKDIESTTEGAHSVLLDAHDVSMLRLTKL
jgi:alpha-galactosidase